MSNISAGESVGESDICKFPPNEKLLTILNTLCQNISNGKYSNDIQNEILESIECYVTGKQEDLDPQIVKFLIQGWWMGDVMEKIKSELSPTDPIICPLCFQKKIELKLTNLSNNGEIK